MNCSHAEIVMHLHVEHQFQPVSALTFFVVPGFRKATVCMLSISSMSRLSSTGPFPICTGVYKELLSQAEFLENQKHIFQHLFECCTLYRLARPSHTGAKKRQMRLCSELPANSCSYPRCTLTNLISCNYRAVVCSR